MENLEDFGKLPEESHQAFKRFLIYREIGPSRSIKLAYVTYLQMMGKPVPARPVVPGMWVKDSRQFRWAERAAKYDINVLSIAGRKVIADYLGALEEVSKNILEAVSSNEIKPQTYEELLKGVNLIGALLTPEMMQTFRVAAL